MNPLADIWAVIWTVLVFVFGVLKFVFMLVLGYWLISVFITLIVIASVAWFIYKITK